MTPNQIHTTITFPVAEQGEWEWRWACEDCPATAVRAYPDRATAARIAAIHENPSRPEKRPA